MADFNTYDISFGDPTNDGTVRTVAWAYHRNYRTMIDIEDCTSYLVWCEVVVVVVAFFLFIYPDLLRAVQSLLSTFVDVSSVS